MEINDKNLPIPSDESPIETPDVTNASAEEPIPTEQPVPESDAVAPDNSSSDEASAQNAETPSAGEFEEASESESAVETDEEAMPDSDTAEDTEPENMIEKVDFPEEVNEIPQNEGLTGIGLVSSLCDSLIFAVGDSQFHGGVRPDNISVREERVYLGNTLQHNVGEFTPQELEYMAPELFWDGIRTPTADVYSLGLVLYSLYNYGRLPFWPASGAITPNARASALQKRMSDEPIPAPANADTELTDVILRALAFRTEERWQNAIELRDALSLCDASKSPADVTYAMSGLMIRGAETRQTSDKNPKANKSDYYDEGDFLAGRRPQRRRNLSWLWIVILVMFIVGALVLLLGDCGGSEKTPPTGGSAISEQTVPTATATPSPTPGPTATPEVTEAPKYRFVVYVEDVSWSEAVARCAELGGRLAMPRNQEEFDTITMLCDQRNLTNVWLGASRQADGSWATPEGETLTYFFWGENEPSFTDSGDGAAEDYMLLWKWDENWTGNDSREDPLENFHDAYSGNIGFVCQMW